MQWAGEQREMGGIQDLRHQRNTNVASWLPESQLENASTFCLPLRRKTGQMDLPHNLPEPLILSSKQTPAHAWQALK